MNGKRILLTVLLCLLSFSLLSFAADPDPPKTIFEQFVNNPDTSMYTNPNFTAFQTAFFAVSIMFLLSGIIFTLGMTLRNHSLQEWGKGEFGQTIINAALIGGIFFLFAPGTGIVPNITLALLPPDDQAKTVVVSRFLLDDTYTLSGNCGVNGAISVGKVAQNANERSIMCYAYNYLFIVTEQLSSYLSWLIWVSVGLGMLVSLNVGGTFFVSVQLSPFMGLQPVFSSLSNAIQMLTMAEAALYLQRTLLVFIYNNAIQTFLPVGIILRSFFSTRKIGGALMAIAIGLYVVYPATFLLNVADPNDLLTAEASQTAEDLKPGDLKTTAEGLDADYSTGASDAKITKYTGLVDHTFQYMGKLFFLAVLMPFLNVFITVIAIKELSALFGSEISLGKFEM
ncbi:MAG: hypothetical protein ABIH99_05605 [Candidatus Micrarchaeota archaeon]